MPRASFAGGQHGAGHVGVQRPPGGAGVGVEVVAQPARQRVQQGPAHAIVVQRKRAVTAVAPAQLGQRRRQRVRMAQVRHQQRQYLDQLGALLGPGLGLIEGVADFFVSFSKLGGGYLGHRVRRKKPWASLGYLVTALATAAMALAGSLGAIVSLRTTAWMARGFRSPLRDYLLADAVEPTHYGRVYGLERAGDMLGADYHEIRVARNPLSIDGPITTLADRPGLGIEVDWDVVRRCQV